MFAKPEDDVGQFLSVHYWRDWSAKRPPICVVCPNGETWEIDRKSSNGDGWKVTGDLPNISCTPSIVVHGYHGHLGSNGAPPGQFTGDIEGRGPMGTGRPIVERVPSAILRRGSGRYFHWCPACEDMHPLPDSWTFNGDVNRPTFAPSFKQSFTHWTGGIDERGKGHGERQERVCHYIITAGSIQFCSDSWHRHSDVIAMPALPERLKDSILPRA